MATAKEYAAWIVANQSKRGTPQFDTVAAAYKKAKANESAAPDEAVAPSATPEQPKRTWLPSVAEGITNIPSGLASAVTGVVGMVTSPVQTAKSAAQAIGGAYANAADYISQTPGLGQRIFQMYGIPPEQTKNAVAVANQVGGHFKRYGTEQGFLEALATDPVGVASDLSMLLGGGAGVASKIGAPAKVTNALRTGAQVTNPFALLTTPVVTKPAGFVAKPVGKAIGGAYDFLSGKSSEIAAGKMLREGADFRLADIQRANEANPNAMASIAAAETATPAYQTLISIGEAKDPAGVAYLREQAIKQAEKAKLAEAAGGTTQTEARAYRGELKGKLKAETDPKREENLRLADLYRTQGRPLEEAAAEASAAAKLAADDVRRFGRVSEDVYFPLRDQPRVETPSILGGARAEVPGVQERANELARTWEPSSGATFAGQPRPPVQSTYPGELAQRAEQFAEKRAGESLAAGETARELETRLSNMKAAGLQPLRPDSVIAAIKRKLATSEGRLNDDANRVLNKVLDKFERSKTKHGDIRADDIYEIRKNGIASAVDELMSGASPTAKKKMAAQLTDSLRPIIDAAIKEAGGKGWDDYLTTFSKGMSNIERKELLAKAMNLYDTSPTQFQRLIEGNDYVTVEKILGRGKYDILQQLQSELGPLQDVLQSVKLRGLAKEKATAGGERASEILAANLSRRRIPNQLSPKVLVANAAIANLQGKVNAKTLRILIEASRTGRRANEVMASLPAYERANLAKYMPLVNQLLSAAPTANVVTNALAEP